MDDARRADREAIVAVAGQRVLAPFWVAKVHPVQPRPGTASTGGRRVAPYEDRHYPATSRGLSARRCRSPGAGSRAARRRRSCATMLGGASSRLILRRPPWNGYGRDGWTRWRCSSERCQHSRPARRRRRPLSVCVVKHRTRRITMASSSSKLGAALKPGGPAPVSSVYGRYDAAQALRGRPKVLHPPRPSRRMGHLVSTSIWTTFPR